MQRRAGPRRRGRVRPGPGRLSLRRCGRPVRRAGCDPPRPSSVRRLLAAAFAVALVACDRGPTPVPFELTGFVRLVLDGEPGGVVLLVQDPDDDLPCGLENGRNIPVVFAEDAGVRAPDNPIGRRVTLEGRAHTVDGTCVLI